MLSIHVIWECVLLMTNDAADVLDDDAAVERVAITRQVISHFCDADNQHFLLF